MSTSLAEKVDQIFNLFFSDCDKLMLDINETLRQVRTFMSHQVSSQRSTVDEQTVVNYGEHLQYIKEYVKEIKHQLVGVELLQLDENELRQIYNVLKEAYAQMKQNINETELDRLEQLYKNSNAEAERRKQKSRPSESIEIHAKLQLDPMLKVTMPAPESKDVKKFKFINPGPIYMG